MTVWWAGPLNRKLTPSISAGKPEERKKPGRMFEVEVGGGWGLGVRAGGVCEQCYWLAAHGIAVDSFLITSLSKALPRHLDHVWRRGIGYLCVATPERGKARVRDAALDLLRASVRCTREMNVRHRGKQKHTCACVCLHVGRYIHVHASFIQCEHISR